MIMNMNRIARIALIILGVGCVVLAVIGIFIPVLPTTPFLLLAAALFARSSRRFYDWLLNNRLFGTYIRNYREGRGITLHHKIAVLVLLWGTMGVSILFWVETWWLRLLLLGIAAAVTLHLVKMPTYRSEK